MKKIRVLVIDDSALVRNILSEGLNRSPNIEVVGTAPDPFVARDKIVQLQPDVLTLDVEMPRMDGVEFLKRLMPQYPLPVIMVSSLTVKGKQITLDALNAGAIDFVSKPTSNMMQGLSVMMGELIAKVEMAARANVSHWKAADRAAVAEKIRQNSSVSTALAETTDKIVAIGASTGGVEAINRVVKGFPPSMPGVVIVQHMPAGFTAMFSERLNQICQMKAKEAQHGDRVMNGTIFVAPGDKHLRVVRSGGIYTIVLEQGEKVSGHRPSVDVMFHSVAQSAGRNAVAAILTGMGADGADGMVAMRKAGARTLAQDEQSSVVFGMPKVAYERGGAERLVALENVAATLISYLRGGG
jgi:two-component system chemotaxis response regulator CheB